MTFLCLYDWTNSWIWFENPREFVCWDKKISDDLICFSWQPFLIASLGASKIHNQATWPASMCKEHHEARLKYLVDKI